MRKSINFFITRKTGKEQVSIMPSSFTGKSKMSHDRVKFFLGDCYYNSGCKKDAMIDVLEKSLGLGPGHSETLMKNHYGGFYIICRPSQFARFMIARHEFAQKNGFVDLQAKLFIPEPEKSVMAKLAERAGVDEYLAQRIVRAMGIGECEVRSYLESAEACANDATITDVSKNPARGC